MSRPKGFHHSKKTIEKQRKSNVGKHNFKHTSKALQKIGKASEKLWQKEWYRKRMIEAVKKPNAGQFKKGFIPWNKGLKFTDNKQKTRWSKIIRRTVKKEKCVLCGSKENLELDHIVAICNGGTNTIENCQVLCKKCNLKKRETIDLVFLQLKQKRANSANTEMLTPS